MWSRLSLSSSVKLCKLSLSSLYRIINYRRKRTKPVSFKVCNFLSACFISISGISIYWRRWKSSISIEPIYFSLYFCLLCSCRSHFVRHPDIRLQDWSRNTFWASQKRKQVFHARHFSTLISTCRFNFHCPFSWGTAYFDLPLFAHWHGASIARASRWRPRHRQGSIVHLYWFYHAAFL